MTTSSQGNYAQVNGINLYYDVRGEGKPLMLLHGSLGAGEMFSEILPLLSAGRQVIAVDLQAHGHTADIDRPITYEALADDIAALIEHLGFEKADVMGYSLGGGVAQQVAIRHPELVRKLVVVSSAFKRSGWYPENLAGMSQMSFETAEQLKQTPMYQAYAQIAPKVDDWGALVAKLGNLLRTEYDWSTDVSTVNMPTLIVAGDADALRTSHLVEYFELLGGGKHDGGWDGSGMSHARLAILPGTTHYTIFTSPALAATVNAFLDAPVQPIHQTM